jgi:hypothetical protein
MIVMPISILHPLFCDFVPYRKSHIILAEEYIGKKHEFDVVDYAALGIIYLVSNTRKITAVKDIVWYDTKWTFVRPKLSSPVDTKILFRHEEDAIMFVLKYT